MNALEKAVCGSDFNEAWGTTKWSSCELLPRDKPGASVMFTPTGSFDKLVCHIDQDILARLVEGLEGKDGYMEALYAYQDLFKATKPVEKPKEPIRMEMLMDKVGLDLVDDERAICVKANEERLAACSAIIYETLDEHFGKVDAASIHRYGQISFSTIHGTSHFGLDTAESFGVVFMEARRQLIAWIDRYETLDSIALKRVDKQVTNPTWKSAPNAQEVTALNWYMKSIEHNAGCGVTFIECQNYNGKQATTILVPTVDYGIFKQWCMYHKMKGAPL